MCHCYSTIEYSTGLPELTSTACLLHVVVAPAGLRSLTLDIDISHSYNHLDVTRADNSAILCAVRPLTQLTELILPSESHPAPAPWLYVGPTPSSSTFAV